MPGSSGITPHLRSGNSYRGVSTQCGLTTDDKINPSEAPIESKRKPWTKEEIYEIMWCYHYCKLRGNNNYINIYKYWRQRNPDSRTNIDANKLQNQRRYIETNKKISADDIKTIIENVNIEIEKESSVGSEHNPPPQIEEVPNEQPVDSLAEEIKAKYIEYLSKEFSERLRLPKLKLNLKARTLIHAANERLKNIMEELNISSLFEINTLAYTTAAVISAKICPARLKHQNKRNAPKIPLWQRRLENKIAHLRIDLSILVSIRNKKMSKEKIKAKQTMRKYDIKDENKLTEIIEELKQKISAKAQRLRRYKQRSDQFMRNTLFQNNPKKFFVSLKNDTIKTTKHPSKPELERYWKDIFESDTKFNEDAKWIKKLQKEKCKMQWVIIDKEELKNALKNTQGWKAPGLDMLPNFWWKQLSNLYESLAKQFNHLMHDDGTIPPWLAEGKTHLVPKNNDTEDPKNFRPITCLNTVYKLLTSIISVKIAQYIDTNNLIPIEQKGCCKGSYGCKDQLLYSKAILEDCQKHKKSLSLAWIDYKKAFDSVPHNWIIKSLELIGISSEVISFCRRIIPTWRTTLLLTTDTTSLQSDIIRIKRGIYQGDSLSPLLFCIAMAPLSRLLNSLKVGYEIKDTNSCISHLIYMDDLKLTCRSKVQMSQMMNVVTEFSKDINMNFGIEKCATANFKNGELTYSEHLNIGDNQIIKTLEKGEHYKYLGIKEGTVIDHKAMKDELRKEYLARVRKILRTHLSARNKSLALGALAVPVLEYSFGIIDWTIDEIRVLDRKTRKLLTLHGMLHPREDVDRLYVRRAEGGRGLRQLEMAYDNAICRIGFYLQSKAETDYILAAAMTNDISKSAQLSVISKSNKIARKKMNNPDGQHQTASIQQIKIESRNIIKENWTNKKMHGQLFRDMNQLAIDKNTSFAWLKYGDLKVETESLIVAAQDQALKTRYQEFMIHKTRSDGRCRICKQHIETVDHIIDSCPILARREYIERHNKVCNQIHYQLCKFYGCQVNSDKWYEHQPLQVTVSEDEKITLLYDQPIITDRKVPANKPDIVIKTGNQCFIIDVAVPLDRNIITKEAEKILKYKSLEIEVQRMWNTKATVIPVVIGATGYVSKYFLENLKQIPGHHNAYQLQKTAILGTAHILRKVIT